jgi:branched-chain amino acid transport system permease protein
MLVEQLLNGLVLGSMYALVALGYTLVFGVLDKLNFAHGEIFMLGGFICLSSLALGIPLWGTLLATVAICGILGLAVELVSFRKFRSADAHVTAALSSLAFGMVLVDLAQKLFGGEPVALELPNTFRYASVTIMGIQVHLVKIGILALTIVLMVVLHGLMTRTAMGRNIRAVAESPRFASLLGINVQLVSQQTFFIASALAGVAGLILAIRTGFANSEVGLMFGLKALAIMAIGGIGDLRGAVIGGLCLGIIEALAVQFGFGGYGEIIVWLLMILVLLFRPGGIFANTHAGGQRA